MTRIALVVIVGALLGCASGPPKIQDAYVWPAKGQGIEQTAQDKLQCYRMAQGFANGVLPAASADTQGAIALGGITAGAVTYELELARRYPPALSKYGACLTARGYSVDWPKGRQP